MQLNSKVYDTMKWVVQIFMPALITLYTGLASAWNWDHVVPTTTTLAAITTFLGVLLGLSSASWRASNDRNAGELRHVDNDADTGMPNLALTLFKTPGEIVNKETVTFKVVPPPPDAQD